MPGLRARTPPARCAAHSTCGQLVESSSSRDGSARVDLAQYDTLHRATATIQNSVSRVAVDFQTNVTTALAYDQGGRLLTSQDPLGRVTVTWYDLLGRKIALDAAAG